MRTPSPENWRSSPIPHYDWLEHNWHDVFDVACCTTAEQFRRETRAITLAARSSHQVSGTKRTTATA